MAYTDPKPGPGTGAHVAGVSAGCLFFAGLLLPLAIVAGMANCGNAAPDCSGGFAGEFLWRGLLALGPVVLLAAALRSLLRWLGARLVALRAGEENEEGVRTPWFALIGLPLALGGGILLVWGDVIFSYA